MTKERLNKEILYQASLSPFKALLGDGVISEGNYQIIDTILRGLYSPIFVEESYQIPLDNKEQ